ncbi:MAG: gliding motility-associated C-terminal domain-containing protein [Bacteroidia bacterium]|nr:gliding motility-associated C-terminal domain-containing protein [Bacteroidia bacterium]
MIHRIFPYFFLFFVVCSGQIFAQKQGNIWYFGNLAGVDFNSGSPVADLNGALITDEGCASICDANGALLFYTDGQEVYDATHTQMPNGFGLKGNASSTQSAVIVPDPANVKKYYIFTVDNLAGSDGLMYSEVDLTQNGGLGDITTKNVPLLAPTTEKITSVNHSNNQDYWVITHRWNSDAFYAYQVTAAGVSSSPVITNIGTVHTGNVGNTLGYLKVSPKGNKICAAIYDTGMYELFDFDNSTGTLSNPISITGSQYPLAYGVEFSPDGNLLYTTVEGSPTHIFQFDLNAANIPASATLVASSTSARGGAVQLASDGKIYFARYDAPWLGVINDPNTVGFACNYQDNGVHLNGRLSKLGLPTFIQSFFIVPEFSAEFFCEGDLTQFTISDPSQLDSVRWDFGDPTTGASNTSTLINPTHVYSGPGTYTYTITFHSNGVTQAQTGELTIHPHASLNLGPDRELCEGDTLHLNATNPEATYLWTTGSTAPTLTVKKDGVYGVTVENYCDTLYDEIQVSFHPSPTPSISNDTFICPGAQIVVLTDTGYASYLWSNGGDTWFTETDKEGKLSVQVVDEFGCKGNNSMRVYFEVCSNAIYIPTAFTPNGDNLNDVWMVVENGATVTDISIFDRWGKLIFNAASALQGWDGKIGNNNLPEGVYSFKLTYLDAVGVEGAIKGSITLVR